jgi:indole-3-glycerol phosphate synthase/phosphoribosylanthranilate isomerase
MADGILGQIVAAKRAELKQRFAGVSLDALRAKAQPTRRSLAAVLGQPGARFIFEIKKASPSAGTIRAGADVTAIARGFGGVADALSVLTDSAFFGGSLADLAAARRVFEGPILAKDFLVDPRQVAEARNAGADAVLVMLSVLGDVDARAMIAEAQRLKMDSLVEVHNEAEMRRALALGAPLIGINNRDLRDLSIDLAITERLAPMAKARMLIAESGIASRADVERLGGSVDGFLVGSALMTADDPAQAGRALAFGRVKLCGLNLPEDFAAAASAAYAGFVFAPGSPRHVTAEQVAPLVGMARQRGMLPVGVFRSAPLELVDDTAALLNLHAVQLHGREDRDYIARLRRRLPSQCEIWTVVSVGRDQLAQHGGDRLLFDNGDGGTGRSFDWALVRGHPGLAKALIAGGIGPANARAAAALGAFAIDVGSSVDAIPGIKSGARMGALFDALRPPCRQAVRACA